MKTVGVIGSGKFGQKIINKLKGLAQIIWVCNSRSSFQSFPLPDWVFVVTPNETHFEMVHYFLSMKVHVFCEKPLCLSQVKAQELIDLAERQTCKLYISDVFNWRPELQVHAHKILKEKSASISTKLVFSWKKYGDLSASLIDKFAYHHLLLLSTLMGELPITQIQLRSSFHPKRFKFSIVYGGQTYYFHYDLQDDQSILAQHQFLGKTVLPVDYDPLKQMIEAVLLEKVSFTQNHRRALWTLSLCEQIKQTIYPKVAIIGAGAYGSTIAIQLANLGFSVHLYEKKSKICQGASTLNQYRIHRGYHYPRSLKTIEECKNGFDLFCRVFPSVLSTDQIDHYYAIANQGSRTTATQFLQILDQTQLSYQIVDSLPNTKLTLHVQERLYNPQALAVLLEKRLSSTSVKIHVDKKITSFKELSDFDHLINCTYSETNQFHSQGQHYKFQLCEKPVLRLPAKYHNQSIVIMDGLFCCIDPLLGSEFHVMGSVEYAIHSCNIGTMPLIPDHYKPYLNRGIIKNPPYTHIDQFKKIGEHYFPDLHKAEHIGSMYTIRAVLAHTEHDDARPTMIDRSQDGIYHVFSGKICGCVMASQKISLFLIDSYNTTSTLSIHKDNSQR